MITEMTLNLDSFNSESLRRIGCALATGELEMPMGTRFNNFKKSFSTKAAAMAVTLPSFAKSPIVGKHA